MLCTTKRNPVSNFFGPSLLTFNEFSYSGLVLNIDRAFYFAFGLNIVMFELFFFLSVNPENVFEGTKFVKCLFHLVERRQLSLKSDPHRQVGVR